MKTAKKHPSKKRLALSLVSLALDVADTYLTKRREAHLKSSLAHVSGKLAEIEALYQRLFAVTDTKAPENEYEEGYRDGMGLVLADLSGVLHPEEFEPATLGLEDAEFSPDTYLDDEGFVVVEGDRG